VVRNRGYLLLVVGLAVLLLVVFILPGPPALVIRAGTRESIAPYQNVISTSARQALAYLAAVRDMGRTLAETDRMEAQIVTLEREVERMKNLERENVDLRAMLGLARRLPYRLISAEVVARGDVTGWWQTVRLSKGEAEGIATNLAVISSEGLVGKTVAVSSHTSDVLLITDPACRVACRLSRVSVFGVLRGGGVSLTGKPEIEMLCAPEPARVDYISKDADLLAGDEVVTSGLGGIFPKDLLIGYVEKAYGARSGLYQHADIVAAAGLGALTKVFVIASGPAPGSRNGAAVGRR
jgi:rod shape-determining protein MreC